MLIFEIVNDRSRRLKLRSDELGEPAFERYFIASEAPIDADIPAAGARMPSEPQEREERGIKQAKQAEPGKKVMDMPRSPSTAQKTHGILFFTQKSFRTKRLSRESVASRTRSTPERRDLMFEEERRCWKEVTRILGFAEERAFCAALTFGTEEQASESE